MFTSDSKVRKQLNFLYIYSNNQKTTNVHSIIFVALVCYNLNANVKNIFNYEDISRIQKIVSLFILLFLTSITSR